jgi:hypothetical protein
MRSKDGVIYPKESIPHIDVGIVLDMDLTDELSGEELARVYEKELLVVRAAKHLMAGMIKGTTKYPTDEHPTEAWLDHLEDEAADILNYVMLMREGYSRGK